MVSDNQKMGKRQDGAKVPIISRPKEKRPVPKWTGGFSK